MPETLGEAIDELAQSIARKALGPHIFDRYIELKRKEWDDYRVQLTKWELDRYLAVLLAYRANGDDQTTGLRAAQGRDLTADRGALLRRPVVVLAEMLRIFRGFDVATLDALLLRRVTPRPPRPSRRSLAGCRGPDF